MQFPAGSAYIDLGRESLTKEPDFSRIGRDGAKLGDVQFVAATRPVNIETSKLPVGTRRITVEYRGGNYRDSTSNAVPITVIPVTPSAAASPSGGNGKANGAEVPWGDWYAGWSMRLRATKATWTHDELPEFTIDLRKRETGEPDAVQQTLHNWLLDVDGRRFRLAVFTTSREHKQVFEPGVARQGFLTFRFHRDETGLHIRTGEGGAWINSYRLDPVGKIGQVLSHPKPDEHFQWTPGKHLVRVAFPMMPKPRARYTESDLASFVISNPVEVLVQPSLSTVDLGKGIKLELVRIPAGLTAKPSADQAKAIAEIEKLGGKVTLDEKSPGKPVHSVTLTGTKVCDAELKYLRGLSRLQNLLLGGTQVTDAGLEHLKDVSQLQYLLLDHTRISDTGLEHLKGLSQLQELRLDGTQVTDAGLEHLKGLRRLQELSLVSTQVTDAGLEHLKGLDKLQGLHLHATQVTDAGLERLKGLSRLQDLSVGYTKLTDAGLERLRGFSQLQRLDLTGTLVTDAGLEHLKGLSKLQYLDLDDTKVTDAGVKKLQQALPKCRIIR